KALSIAEAISPSILWIDEIEKGLSGIESSGVTDAGTSARVFGTILTWMQEKEKPVFVVATANNIENLPPELLRKGRFDEIFFVDLPGRESRKDIWRIHLRKRLKEKRYQEHLKYLDMDRLVELTKGFSGAEIEEALNEALYGAYYDNKETLSMEYLEKAIKETYPLSKIMGEVVLSLRRWAKVRARRASNEEPEEMG
ncbi:MAG TPA: AAA family ATPase, partial [Candidatus Atribacteria bacterium]|nr:AAA family ATPase [Candidatus Atribacteria bacterium]